MDLEETRHFYYAFLANPPHPPPSSSHRHSLPPHMLSGMTLSLISQRKLKPSPQLLTAELLPTPILPSCCSRRGLPPRMAASPTWFSRDAPSLPSQEPRAAWYPFSLLYFPPLHLNQIIPTSVYTSSSLFHIYFK